MKESLAGWVGGWVGGWVALSCTQRGGQRRDKRTSMLTRGKGALRTISGMLERRHHGGLWSETLPHSTVSNTVRCSITNSHQKDLQRECSQNDIQWNLLFDQSHTRTHTKKTSYTHTKETLRSLSLSGMAECNKNKCFLINWAACQ